MTSICLFYLHTLIRLIGILHLLGIDSLDDFHFFGSFHFFTSRSNSRSRGYVRGCDLWILDVSTITGPEYKEYSYLSVDLDENNKSVLILTPITAVTYGGLIPLELPTFTIYCIFCCNVTLHMHEESELLY